ncbi:hypothetical protein HanHA300_Chr09g0305221 [Helianthus annuus]|nr:hypothetical protein HanHA300_Chr09g0305221 [Helianthus annuus]KAJ0541199.1 hypothetical protein HanHA89_Chr09g0325701 [Helianthus annuus]KAJ0706281.1 hypothetical protein HanLR1_Chr09g0305201 [Helianthus annuus]
MIPRGRGKQPFSSNRGRGRGRGKSQDIVLAQQGNRRLIASSIASGSLNIDNTSSIQISPDDPSYAHVAQDDDDESWVITDRQKKIIILNQEDIKFFDDPWVLMQRYIEPASYNATSYKPRQYYESIIQISESTEIRHFFPADKNKNSYNFSKIFIKSILSPQKWGLSTFNERGL